MKKNDKTPVDNTWDIEPETATTAVAPATEDVTWTVSKETKAKAKPKVEAVLLDSGFDMEGLMTDFPTATELQKFVYDQTGIALNLKGRANKLKYQVALDTLNGVTPDAMFMSGENPYLDKNELVPTEPFKDTPAKDPAIKGFGPEVNKFDTNLFPHPDPELRAQDQKSQVCFKKYANGAITYEILGPVAQRAIGEKINKFGQKQPEKYVWIDPRNGEQVIRHGDGTYTALGTRLRSFMKRQRMNNTNQWDVWIDRDFVVSEEFVIDNPWNTN
jgi:hypothetical protein